MSILDFQSKGITVVLWAVTNRLELRSWRRHRLRYLFSDPLEAQPHDPDVKALLRIAQVYDIPIANNKATADFMVTSKFMDEEYQHNVLNFKQISPIEWKQ